MRTSSALFAIGALFASTATAAPLLDVGASVGLTLNTLNSCIFSNVLTKTLDPTKVLDLKTNVCLSAAACLAVKTNEIVSQTVVNGLIALPVCKVKTCPATLSLNKDGLCICIDGSIFSDSTKNSCIPKASCTKTNVISGSGASAYCKPKTCAKTLTLNSDGLCVCASGLIFSGLKKSACIEVSKCNPLLATVLGGVCTPKKCSAGQLLHGTTGICIDAALCTSVLNTIVTVSGGSSICKPKKCPTSTVLNEQTGLCVCVGDKIFKDAKKAACISVSSCSSKLNSVVGGVCLPKVCLSGQILDGKSGLCIDLSLCNPLLNTLTGGVCKPKTCASGKKLSLTTGLCELTCAVGSLLEPAKTKCIASSLCLPALNDIIGGVCTPKAKCSQSSSLYKLLDGVCQCGDGLSLNVAGLCVSLSVGL